MTTVNLMKAAAVEPLLADMQDQVNAATAQAVLAATEADAAAISAAAAAASEAAAELANDAAQLSRGIFASTTAGLSKGVVSTASLVGGSGGTNGTFALAFSGGAGSNAAGTFVVDGGAVTQITISNPGTGYTSAPTISFAASSGLTGASATAVIDYRNPVGTYFSVPASGNDSLILYRVDSGPAATEVARYPSSNAALKPLWTGLPSAWVDPTFRAVEVGTDFAGRSRWKTPYAGVYTLEAGSIFGGRKMRRPSSAGTQFGGPRIWIDEIEAGAGDTITVRALITGSGVTGGIAFRFYDASDANVGSEVPMRQPDTTTVVVTSGTPVLFAQEAVIPAGAVGARVYSSITSGTGYIDVEALWASKGAKATTPAWPMFAGDPAAHAAAFHATEELAAALEPVDERLTLLEGGANYMLIRIGGVDPEVEAGDIELAVSSVVANSTYGDPYRGWAERYTPAGVSFNAVRIRSLGRAPTVAVANYWRTIKVVVRSAAANAHLGASATLVATGETLVDPYAATLEDVVVILRDPMTGAVVTLDDSDLGTEYLIGVYASNIDGGAAYCSPHRGAMSNTIGSPASYYITTGDPETGDWVAFTGNWRLGVDHLLLTAPVDTSVYLPSNGFREDMGLSAGQPPDVTNSAGLRQYAAKVTAGDEVIMALIGDSWTNSLHRIVTPLRTMLDTVYDFSAPGWISANSDIAVPPMGARTISGTWTGVRASTAAIGPDNAHATTTDTAAYLTFGSTDTVDRFYLHYLQQPDGGEFSWSVNGGPPTVVDTNGANTYQVIEINGPGTLRVDIDTAGLAGVIIVGCDVRNATVGEVVLHKLGAGGARADHFAGMGAGYLEAAFASMAPDVVMICLGTNDHASSIGLSAYRASVKGIIERVRSVAPLADILLIGPGPNGNSGAYEIDDYNNELYAIAAESGLSFINLKTALGSYADADARGLYEDTSHPNTAGGLVIGRALWRGMFRE